MFSSGIREGPFVLCARLFRVVCLTTASRFLGAFRSPRQATPSASQGIRRTSI